MYKHGEKLPAPSFGADSTIKSSVDKSKDGNLLYSSSRNRKKKPTFHKNRLLENTPGDLTNYQPLPSRQSGLTFSSADSSKGHLNLGCPAELSVLLINSAAASSFSSLHSCAEQATGNICIYIINYQKDTL